ncbi:MAG TPA: hypothetical protein VGL56_04955 [Fimbriimonadaceae bacterium]|jgi:hypothetical protein
MKKLARNFAIILAPVALAVPAAAQTNIGTLGGIRVITGLEGSPPDWFTECTDPANMMPLSNPYVTNSVANELMFGTVGAGGTWTSGGGTTTPTATTAISPCFLSPNGPYTMQNSGRFCFSYGSYFAGGGQLFPQGVGSIQQYSPGFHDAAMALNYGAPSTPGDCFANFVQDGGTPQYFGSTVGLFYRGESNRYVTLDGTVGSFGIVLQMELVADAIRLRWTCTNNSTAPHTLSLWFASGIDMLTDQSAKYWQGTYVRGNFGSPYLDPNQNIYYGPDQAGEPPFYIDGLTNPTGLPGRLSRDEVPAPEGYQGIYVYLPVGRPPVTDSDYNLNTDPVDFPSYVDLVFGESDPFGMRIETKPSSSTKDVVTTNIPNSAYEVTLGKHYFILDGDLSQSSPIMQPTALIPDTGFLDTPAFIIKYNPVSINPGATGQILNYVRSTWGNSSYTLPFGAVVDAPSVVQEGSLDYSGKSTTPQPADGLINNPMKIRVWIDNVGGNVTSGYGVTNKEFELDQVQVNLTFGVPGITITSAGGATQTITKILPRTTGFVDFTAVVGSQVVGQVPYTVTINTVPINTKVLNGTFEVSGRPRLELHNGANLITAPYVFQDSSWIDILSNFVAPTIPGASVQTYIWDANRQGYDISLSASRGNSIWAVYNNPTGKPVFADFNGTPSITASFDDTTQQIELKPGWNMIANPFDLEFPINEINGVAASNSSQVYTYNELVGLGYLSGYAAAWDPVGQAYGYIDGNTGNLEPNTGYWVDNLLQNDITIAYPPLFSEATPGSSNRAPSAPIGVGEWVLQLNVAEGLVSDIGNSLRTVNNMRELPTATIYKVPMAPTQKLELAFVGANAQGKSVLLHQAVAVTNTSYVWNAVVNSQEPGNISVSWPQITTVPAKFGVLLVDKVNGVVVDMRQSPSYTYTEVTQTSQRQFQIVVKPITTGAIVTSIASAPTNLGTKHEEQISYKLAVAATTTSKIYTATGVLVATLHSNRADKVGVGVDLWNMENTLNKAVAPGSYTVKISAVTATGVEETKTAVVVIK